MPNFLNNITLKGTFTVGIDDTGYDVIFYGATSGYYMMWDESADDLLFTDGVIAKFGTGKDLQIYHDGSNSYIKQQSGATGNLYIAQEFLIILE